MQEARRDAEALGADAVALVEAYSQTGIQQRAGAFGLSAGLAMDLRLGWDLGLEAGRAKAQKRLSDEKPYLLILSPMCLAFSQLGGTAGAGQASLGVCMQSGRITNPEWRTRFSSNILGRRTSRA